MENKVGTGPLKYYKGNIKKAVADSFPEIGAHIPFFYSFSLLTLFSDKALAQKRHPCMY